MEKENVVLIFGGRSAEHDISIITGLQALKNVDETKYNFYPIYVSKSGEMLFGKKLFKIESYSNFSKKGLRRVSFRPADDRIYLSRGKGLYPSFKVSCAILCLHGLNGEDGTIQGLLELSKIPYTSSNVLSSAICMDKIIMKDVLRANNILTPKSCYIKSADYYLNEEEILSDVTKNLELFSNSCFVKPANLGSSIGISKCSNLNQLMEAVDVAFSYDQRIIIEQAVEDAVEVNCAVLGDADYQIVSDLEYPKSWSSFLSFDEKYISRKEEKLGKKKLSKKLEEEVKRISKETFKIFDCSGVVRIDFLVLPNEEKIYLNELNSIPGSLAFYLFKNQNLDFKRLLNKLIEIGKRKFLEKNSNKYSFESRALANFGSGIKTNKYTK